MKVKTSSKEKRKRKQKQETKKTTGFKKKKGNNNSYLQGIWVMSLVYGRYLLHWLIWELDCFLFFRNAASTCIDQGFLFVIC